MLKLGLLCVDMDCLGIQYFFAVAVADVDVDLLSKSVD